MNLKEFHKDNLGVQSNMIFPTTEGKVISLQIQKGSQLKEHITKVPAILICILGCAVYEDEKGIRFEKPKLTFKLFYKFLFWI